jgi:hypothetical protein
MKKILLILSVFFLINVNKTQAQTFVEDPLEGLSIGFGLGASLHHQKFIPEIKSEIGSIEAVPKKTRLVPIQELVVEWYDPSGIVLGISSIPHLNNKDPWIFQPRIGYDYKGFAPYLGYSFQLKTLDDKLDPGNKNYWSYGFSYTKAISNAGGAIYAGISNNDKAYFTVVGIKYFFQ